MPTAISLASTDDTFADDLQQLLHCGKSFRVYSNPDFIGVQLGGAVKNVIAIGAGMSDGSEARQKAVELATEARRRAEAPGQGGKGLCLLAGGETMFAIIAHQFRRHTFHLATVEHI